MSADEAEIDHEFSLSRVTTQNEQQFFFMTLSLWKIDFYDCDVPNSIHLSWFEIKFSFIENKETSSEINNFSFNFVDDISEINQSELQSESNL